MQLYICPNHDLTALQPIAVPLRLDREVTYQVEAGADGVGRNIGGATASLAAEALAYDEAMLLLNQLGLSLNTPSRRVTVVLPDRHRIPTPFYGVVTLSVSGSGAAWWRDFRLEFTGLVRA